MLTIILLGFLFALVITAGVLTLLKSLKSEPPFTLVTPATKELSDIKNQDKIVGSSLIGVGVIGLGMVVYMGYNGGGATASSNFGFKFY
jgi:hypothetical protein